MALVVSVAACEQGAQVEKEDEGYTLFQHIVCFTPDGQLLFTGETSSAVYTEGLWIVTMGHRVLTTNGQCMQEFFKVQAVEPEKEAEQSMTPPPAREPEKEARPIDGSKSKQFVHPWEDTL